MATLIAVNPRQYSGTVMAIDEDHYIKNGQSWACGEFLYADTSGRLLVSGADGAKIQFQAMTDVTDPGSEDLTKAPVRVVRDDVTFIGNMTSGTDPAVDVLYSLDVSDNICTIDPSAGSNKDIKVTGLLSNIDPINYTSADTLAKVLFRVIYSGIDA